jgi:hypothetical protein
LGACLDTNTGEPFNEPVPVNVITEDGASLYSPYDNMMQSTGSIYTRFPWHMKNYHERRQKETEKVKGVPNKFKCNINKNKVIIAKHILT